LYSLNCTYTTSLCIAVHSDGTAVVLEGTSLRRLAVGALDLHGLADSARELERDLVHFLLGLELQVLLLVWVWGLKNMNPRMSSKKESAVSNVRF
jgi:hypothetical protein